MHAPRVLAIDDEPKILDIVKYFLEMGGCRVETYSDPQDALDAARKRPFDVIVLDVVLEDTDGYEVAGEFKKIKYTQDAPVLFLSARIEVADLFLENFEGRADFLPKPFKKDELVARVKSLAAGAGRKVSGRKKPH